MLRSLALLAVTLVLVLALPNPAMAQSASASPGASQYGQGGADAAADAADIPPALTDNARQGTGAVNEALTGDSSGTPTGDSASPAAASPSAASPEENITALPETGGPPLTPLLAGASLLLLLPLVVAARSG